MGGRCSHLQFLIVISQFRPLKHFLNMIFSHKRKHKSQCCRFVPIIPKAFEYGTAHCPQLFGCITNVYHVDMQLPIRFNSLDFSLRDQKFIYLTNGMFFSYFFSHSFSVCILYSLGPLETLPREMVSRRKILSRSRDDLNLEHQYQQQDDEEDVWYQKDKLYKVSALRTILFE